MTVYFYAEGEHPAGFVGFRAVTSLGNSKDVCQKYWSLNDYSYNEAERLAHETNEKWRADADADAVKLSDKLNVDVNNDTLIAKGFRCAIRTERKFRSGVHKKYYVPCFVIATLKDVHLEKAFRISTNKSYENVFRQAVEFYRTTRRLPEEQYLELLARIPDKKVFWGIYKQKWEQGEDISAATFSKQLG